MIPALAIGIVTLAFVILTVGATALYFRNKNEQDR